MIKIKHKCRIKTTKRPLGLTKLCAQLWKGKLKEKLFEFKKHC